MGFWSHVVFVQGYLGGLTDLCGDSKLGNNLAVGVDSSTKAWPELRWVEKIGKKIPFLVLF